VILVEGVWKAFGSTVALKGVDLAVEQGSIHALLGRNGAGKSTLVRILSTLLSPDAGSARIGGADVVQDPHRVRSLIGLAGQAAAVDPTLTGRENLELVGQLYGLRRREARARAQEVLERLSLTAAADQRVLSYSGGMRRRVDLGASLVGRPLVLIMDEPTTGLDPGTRRDLWKLVEDLAHQGTTVLLTTQYLEEADRLATQIAVLDGGRIIAAGTPTELKDRLEQDVLEVGVGNGADLERVRRMLVGLGSGEPVADSRWQKVTLPTTDRISTLVSAGSRIAESGIGVKGFGLRRPTLDEVFLTLTANGRDSPVNGKPLAPPSRVEADEAPARTSPRRRRPRRVVPVAGTALVVALLAVAAVIFVWRPWPSGPQSAGGHRRLAAAPTSASAGHTHASAGHTHASAGHANGSAGHTHPAAGRPTATISGVAEGRTIALGGTPGGMTADQSGNIWVSLPTSGAVLRISPDTGQRQTFHVGGRPTAIAAAADRIWVAGSSAGALASLNTVTGQPLSYTRLATTPTAISLDGHDQSLCAIDSTGTLIHLNSTGSVVGAAKLAHPSTGVGCGEGWVWAAQQSPPALVRMGDTGGARQFNGGPSPVALAFDDGVWIANRNGTVTAFNPHLNELRVTRELTVGPELDGIYAAENNASVWAFSRQTRALYRISNTAQPSLTATIVFNSPPAAIVVIGRSVWVATQDGNLTQIQY
jgi:daunorubicin resistance ABC transporter ATP-binding subunit